ncbi:hypothetical protein BU25DRAFT_302552, partial [Macroventuria anomochaeta]
ARKWLAECCENHTSCCDAGDAPTRVLPNRILDLGTHENADEDICLLEPTALYTGRYICLSHCWGSSGCALKTTTRNADEHKLRIQFSDLPKTFQHAVNFTRWLGVRYLWIDALCIIQDDQDDWCRESPTMASVYADSCLTLSAASA